MSNSDQIKSSGRQALANAARDHHGQLLALLIKDLRDFQLAEDSLQDAIESALIHWQRSGPPNSPIAWLLQTARRKAIDRLRRVKNFNEKSPELSYLVEIEQDQSEREEPDSIPDERLRLIFTCCHPALDPHTAVALSLRTLCGLTTPEIARAFVVSEDTMAQRLARARQKIAKAGIAYEVPEPPHMLPRLQAVLRTLYLTFNEGYAATRGHENLRVDFCEEAIRLARMVNVLCPNQPEVLGLLALLLFTHARRQARSSARSLYIPIEDQDRTIWDQAMITEADRLLIAALGQGSVGPYQLQAAISAIHAEAKTYADTRWAEIILLYNRLFEDTHNPVFLLNRAVALSFASGADEGLAALETLTADLQTYQPFHAARADMLRRLHRFTEASLSYERAIALSQNEAERQFLLGRKQSIYNNAKHYPTAF